MKFEMTPEQFFFRAIPHLSLLENEQIFELARKTTKRKYYKGEYVFLQGDPVDRIYFLEMGKVEIYKSAPNGKKLTLWNIGESEMFCLATLFSPAAFANALVANDSLIYSLPKVDFEGLIASSGEFSKNLVHCICNKFALYSSLLDDVAFKKIENRLAKAILHSQHSAFGHDYVCQLSQTELASLAGTSREVVNRILRSLRERGIISLPPSKRTKCLILSDIEKLREIARS